MKREVTRVNLVLFQTSLVIPLWKAPFGMTPFITALGPIPKVVLPDVHANGRCNEPNSVCKVMIVARLSVKPLLVAHYGRCRPL